MKYICCNWLQRNTSFANSPGWWCLMAARKCPMVAPYTAALTTAPSSLKSTNNNNLEFPGSWGAQMLASFDSGVLWWAHILSLVTMCTRRMGCLPRVEVWLSRGTHTENGPWPQLDALVMCARKWDRIRYCFWLTIDFLKLMVWYFF